MKYYKATRPDGRDFYTGTVDYAEALRSGRILHHPRKGRRIKDDPCTYFSVSTEPADCTGMYWPCRLFRVEPVGPVGTSTNLTNKRTCKALRVLEELPAWQALGPNGQAVAAVIERDKLLTPSESKWLNTRWHAIQEAAREAARNVTRNTARDAAKAAAWAAAWAAARDAARDAAGDAVWDAWEAAGAAATATATALVVRDLLIPEQFDVLTQPWRDVIGPTWEEAS